MDVNGVALISIVLTGGLLSMPLIFAMSHTTRVTNFAYHPLPNAFAHGTTQMIYPDLGLCTYALATGNVSRRLGGIIRWT